MIARKTALFALAGLTALLAKGAGKSDVVAAGAPQASPEPGTCAIFPLPIPAKLLTDFGDPRGKSRHHEGMDLIAPKMTPVLAVAPGTVTWMHDEIGGRCCDVEIEHDDGWSSRYIHLNNDTPGTDDGKGYGIAPELREGSRVATGDLVGWVGDSGNAENAGPHLHFELRDRTGSAVNPYDALECVMPKSGDAEPPPS